MRTLTTLLCAAATMAAVTMPAFSMDMMKKGDTMMMMSNGGMSTMHPMAGHTMDTKGFKPMKGCVVMMLGNDGKMYWMQSTDKKCGDMGKMM